MRRLKFYFLPTLLVIFILIGGCGSSTEPDLVWGERGVINGAVVKPRAAAIDDQGRLYLVDWTARIQVFDLDGKYVGPSWTTPDYRNGRPSGLSIDIDGNLLVSDSHYSCARVYSPEGKLLKTIGGNKGTKPGELGYISDALQDEDGNYYLAEFGEVQRISKLNKHGRFLKCWGTPGNEPGQFARIRAMTFGPDGLIYVADACNHRIQVFTRDGELVRHWGKAGSEDGQLSYPYDVAFSSAGTLYVIEYGNNRVQKFTREGKSLGTWGGPGREPGKFFCPWALVVDHRGRVHVIDSQNHRVQRIWF